MGAWGLGLFQSDHDYDRVDEFNEEAGIDALEAESIAKVEASGKKVKHRRDAGDASTVYVHFSMDADLCSHSDLVRKYLDYGVLGKLLNKYAANLPPSNHDGYHLEGYKFVLLGACGMSLGCKISEHHKSLIKKYYKNVGLMREALKQMGKALDTYVTGVSYDFESLGLHDMIAAGGAPREDRLLPYVINVQPPGGIPRAQAIQEAIKGLAKDKAEMAENKYDYDVCGKCGAKEGAGGTPLLKCGKCKRRKYCGMECQKKHWKLHKGVCGRAQSYTVGFNPFKGGFASTMTGYI
ncbi:hypothetical protein LTR37_015762 [Vermiconidia calcicola]|uniref:Uncharacterized protein n=1 Tax=Vermiconidia calcicola TaxID=1690605 RepID=A0ACC3MPR8_9PEZI|nr:hypothetical protein LTR37_015762 [Vermiconidia calcicola]